MMLVLYKITMHPEVPQIKKVEIQVGNYCLLNYEEELWPGQITKIISRSRIRVKYYKKATAHAGSTWR